MRTLILNDDLKRLFAGAAIAVVAGLAMGAAMQPNLSADATEGPQQLLGRGGERTFALLEDPGVGAYRGRIPDYVVGTDVLQPPQTEVLAYNDHYGSAPSADEQGQDADTVAPSRWQDEPTGYPSEHGNRYHDSDLPPPPEPPSADDDVEPAAT